MSSGVDLTPMETRAVRAFVRRLAGWGVAGGALILLGLAAAGMVQVRTIALEKTLSPLRERLAESESLKARLPVVEHDIRAAMARQPLLDTLQRATDWSGLLRDAAEASSGKTRIVRAELGTAAEPRLVSFTGEALSHMDALEFMSRLAASEQIDHLELAKSTRQSDGREAVDFQIHGRLRGRP